jgi:hypothetical protein
VTSPAVHFVGFRGDEFWSAVKVWGRPGLIHIGWDRRALRDIGPDDTVIFATGTEHDPFPVNRRTGLEMNYPDILETLP